MISLTFFAIFRRNSNGAQRSQEETENNENNRKLIRISARAWFVVNEFFEVTSGAICMFDYALPADNWRNRLE